MYMAVFLALVVIPLNIVHFQEDSHAYTLSRALDYRRAAAGRDKVLVDAKRR